MFKQSINFDAIIASTLDNTHETTARLLEHAYKMLEEAEQKIATQSGKIRELEDLACTDPLTGLMNRRGFEKFFAQEVERIRRYHSTGCVFVLIDLDRFKEINDLHGHQAGDACLKMAGAYLLDSIRITDGAARLGGDEFALLLTQTDAEKIQPRLDKIRNTLDNMYLELDRQKLRFGASMGTETVFSGSDLFDIYRTADRQLYADKRLKKSQSAETVPA